MWKEYFGDKARIYGVDVNPDCKKLEEKNIEIFIGSQSDRAFLRSVASRVPPIDILIDDGGHKMSQQIATFEELFSKVKPDGVYLCEDSHTSYRLVYGGGHERNGTFIEYSKRLIDALNAYHSEQSSLKVTEFTKTVNSIHFYDSVVVIEKKARGQPTVSRSGEPSLGSGPPDTVRRATVRKAKYRVLFLLNATLRALDLPGIKWR